MNPICFGRYILIDRLAAGGMGEVYIAVPPSLWGMGKLFAIKKILPALSRDAEFLGRFRDEAKLLIPLNHPNIVQVFEVGRVGDEYFISMEYVEGASVGQLLSRWWQLRDRMSLPVVAAMRIVCELLAGIEYCHTRKDASGQSLQLVHRDISPGNVLLSFDGAVKLADFGLASHRDRGAHTNPHCVIGHLGYIAPEVMEGKRADQRADLFSAGVLLFELLTCQKLIPGDAPADLRRLLHDRCLLRPSRLRSDIPAALDAVVARALAVDPAERYPSARAFQDDLQQLRVRLDPLFDARAMSETVMHAFFHPGRRRRLLHQRLQAVDLEEVEQRAPGRRTICLGEAIPLAYENTAEQDAMPPLLMVMDDASVPGTQPELFGAAGELAGPQATSAGLKQGRTEPLLSAAPAAACAAAPAAPRRRGWLPAVTYLGPSRSRRRGRRSEPEGSGARRMPLFIEAKTET